MKKTGTITWENFHSFYEIDKIYEKLRGKQGVYLWVYNGKPKRVVYIGTGTGIDGLFRRLCKEKSEMLSGEGYCFKVQNNIDAYKEFLQRDPYVIAKFVKESKFYYPGSEQRNDFTTYDFIDYLKNISIYICDLTKIKNEFSIKIEEISKILETQIQTYLIGLNGISYYKKRGFQSWLGRIEKLRKSNFKDDFQNLLKYNLSFSIREIEDLTDFNTEISLNKIREKLQSK